jgi:pyrrolidone-carboxylate peptidase
VKLRRFAVAVAASTVLGTVLTGCADADEGDATDDSSEVRVDTRTPLARAQYDANVAFLGAYTPRCTPSADPNRPRVLVTGFGRFMSVANNATGRIVSTLVPSAPYPETQEPPADTVDPPAPQLSVGTTTLDIAGIGPVDVCGMILPVYWDVAAILIAREADAFAPNLVMMNGVAGVRQPIWLELGALNRAAALQDGSNNLAPYVPRTQNFAKLVESAPESETARPNLMSWQAVQRAARGVIEAHATDGTDAAAGKRLGDILHGAELAGFPRSSNTYLCNNVTYTTGYMMDHPGKSVTLLRATPRKRGAINEVKVKIARDLSRVPRLFIHWPSEMADLFHAQGADVLKAIIGAQLGAEPTRGDNAMAAPDLAGGDVF